MHRIVLAVAVTAIAAACTVTFTDKKGNTATLPVNVVFSGDGSCWV